MGFDVHPFSQDAGRRLMLGGVEFDGPGLEGNSDGDVVAHAIADAILGAAGLGDLGQHFPDSDESWTGADSIDLLGKVAALVAADGWALAGADCAVVLEQPRLAPRRDQMQQTLSAAAGGPVRLKGKRAEGLGALGRAEGIACWAVALLWRESGSSVSPVTEQRP